MYDADSKAISLNDQNILRRKKENTNVSTSCVIRIGLVSVLLGAIGYAPAAVTPLPLVVRRIAVLPPYRLGAADTRPTATENQLLGQPSRTIEDLLAQQAGTQLQAKGFDVVAPTELKLATKDQVPTSPQMAAQILRQANLDAAALYIEVQRWEPMPDARGLKADGIIVALDVAVVDPKTGKILWEVHRPSRPVPLYGVVLTGQAHLFVAETVMREIFAQLAPGKPST